MKKKKTTATATTTPSSSQKQSVLSRFFTQIAPPKKLAEENGSNTQQQQQHPQSITPPPPPTTTTKKIPAKKSTTPQKPPKKRLKKIVNDDDDDDDDEIFKDDSSDEVFDDDSDEDYSSGDNEPSYFSDEDYESDAVSESDDREEGDSFSDELESDEDTKKRRKQKQKRTTSTKRQKKEDALKDFENDTNSDSNKCDNSASDETTAADDAENVSSSTKECVGLEKYSIDSTEEVAINEKRHKAFVNKLRRIQNEKDTKSTGVSGKPKYTPMEQQVLEMKRQYPDCVLAFEVGYKFMLYGRDAEIANEVLKVYCYQDHNFLTAMIPTVRLNFHVRRLVQAGHKVGLVRQTEVAAVKALSNSKHKPFTRSLTDLYTPATLVGSDLESVETDLSSSRNYMLCIYEHPRDGTISFVVKYYIIIFPHITY